MNNAHNILQQSGVKCYYLAIIARLKLLDLLVGIR